jgi:hypothetical protein
MVNAYGTLEKLDCFGSSITFRVNNSSKHKTQLGGFITILCFVIFMLLIYNFGKDIYYKTNPSIQEQNIYDPDNVVINITNSKELFFALQLCKSTFTPDGDVQCDVDYDPSVFNIHFSLVNMKIVNGSRVYEHRRLNHSYCNITDIDESLVDRFQLNSLNQSLCVRDRNLVINGQYESAAFSYLRISVDKCETDCKSDDEIRDLISFYKVAFFYTYGVEDLIIHKQSITTRMESFGMSLSYNFYKKRDLFLQQRFIYDDEKLFVNSPGTSQLKDTFTGFGSQADEINQNLVKGSTRFFGAYIRTSPNYIEITRSYKKIPTILSEVFAVFKYLLILFFYFINIANYHSLKDKILGVYFEGSKSSAADGGVINASLNISSIKNADVSLLGHVVRKRASTQPKVPYCFAFVKKICCCWRRVKRFRLYDQVLKQADQIFSLSNYIEIFLKHRGGGGATNKYISTSINYEESRGDISCASSHKNYKTTHKNIPI